MGTNIKSEGASSFLLYSGDGIHWYEDNPTSLPSKLDDVCHENGMWVGITSSGGIVFSEDFIPIG